MSPKTQLQKSGSPPLRYVVQIDVAPYQSEIADLAYLFCKSALELGERLELVFFYGDGVYHALECRPPQGEEDKTGRWLELAERFSLELVACPSSLERRGVRLSGRAAEQFRLAGLASLAEAILSADRYLRFG